MVVKSYPVAAHPTMFKTELGDEIELRPMLPTDKEGLLDFFRRIPEEDRYSLKENVISSTVIAQWVQNLDYQRVLPILAVKEGKIIADGSLHFSRAGSRRHIGEVRIVVDPDYRRQGLGRRMLNMLIEIAEEEGLERLMFELASDTEETAKHTARTLGFVPVAIIPNIVKDIWGKYHDLVTMQLRVEPFYEEEPVVF
ncbi:MAG: GNAT family N-acetyltransferase [SAR202 cluster bacterium]|nr:GNAT family N-acetyltransferase [SAR202 cluster bacterium]